MNRKTDGWMDRETYGQRNKHTDGQTDVQTDIQTHRPTDMHTGKDQRGTQTHFQFLLSNLPGVTARGVRSLSRKLGSTLQFLNLGGPIENPVQPEELSECLADLKEIASFGSYPFGGAAVAILVPNVIKEITAIIYYCLYLARVFVLVIPFHACVMFVCIASSLKYSRAPEPLD
jgi:hypothetical protein